MPSVASGSRLLMRTEHGLIVLRSTDRVDLERGDGWSVPVLGDAASLAVGAVPVEVPTDAGLLTVLAAVCAEDGVLLLRPLGEAPAIQVQRRDAVRVGVQVPVRGAILDRELSRVVDLEEDLEVDFAGLTRDVSGGGLGIDFVADDAPHESVGPGSRLYLELDLPAGRQVQALLDVVTYRRGFLRGSFVDLPEGDRDAVVALVFAHQRAELALRKREREAGGEQASEG